MKSKRHHALIPPPNSGRTCRSDAGTVREVPDASAGRFVLNRRRFLAAGAALAALRLLPGRVAAAAGQVFSAGAATSKITLPLGATNGGVILRGAPASEVHDELHARCLVLDDGELRLAFAVCDERMIARPFIEAAKRLVRERIGLPADQILIAATHTHAAPAVIGLEQVELDRSYPEFVAGRIADGICRAAERLAPAHVGWGSAQVPQHVFNRRWRLKPGGIPPNPYGQSTDRVLMNPPPGTAKLVAPAGPVDPQLMLVSVRHADGRPLALLANYGVHYIGGYQGSAVSADYFGAYAERIEELLGASRQEPPFVAMMSNGTSGDVSNVDARRPRRKEAPWTRMRAVADDLARTSVQVLQKIECHAALRLAAATAELELGVRKPDAARLDWARQTLAKTSGEKRLSRPRIYAEEAMHLAKFPATMPVKLQAFRIGTLGIAAIPCEVFAETGLAIKQASPLQPTFVMELANGYNGYLPTLAQHELGGYESWPSRGAYLEIGAEEKIRARTLDLIRRVCS